MFTTSRRPVPSTAALRVLRQLAYISSGTVCGAAALIAEERRRQTRVAKKIVENTRRLKQHPRYAHSTARAEPSSSAPELRPTQDDGVYMDSDRAQTVIYGPGDSSPFGAHSYETTRVRPEPDAFRNDELPSEVDKSYKKYSRRERGTQSHNGEDGGGRYRSTRLSNQGSRLPGQHAPAAFSKRPLNLEPGQTGHKRHGQVKDGIASDLKFHNPERAFLRLVSYAKLDQAKSQPESQLDALHSVTVDEQHLPSSNQKPMAAAELEVIANMFLTLYPMYSEGLEGQPLALASRLLEAILQTGAVAPLKDVTLWLLLRGELGADQLAAICTSTPVFSQNNSGTVAGFYTELLADRHFEKWADLGVYKLLITASMLRANKSHPAARIPVSLSISIKASHSDRVADRVLECCRKLLELRLADSIPRLLRYCGKQLGMFNQATTPVVTEIFSLSLELKDLPETAALLDLIGRGCPAFENCLRKLLSKCKDEGADRLLIHLHKKYSQEYRFPAGLYPALCSAYSRFDIKLAAGFILRGNKNVLDDSTLVACQVAWAAIIRRTWTDTNNFKHTKALFVRMQDLAGERTTDIALYNAMIQACVNAGQTSEAEKLLREVQGSDTLQPDASTFGYFVLSAAKARDWQGVQNLLAMLDGQAMTCASSVHYSQLFNPLLREFAQQHDPIAVWSFVSAAIDINGIQPNHATCDLVLESFVRGKRPDFISKWFTYMQTLGHDFKLNAHTAMRMVRRYYYDTRPSHVVMMWLCHNLTLQAPELQSQDLMLLVRESIGYDMRKLRGPNSAKLLELARLRLQLLENTRDHIPAPPLNIGILRRKLDLIDVNKDTGTISESSSCTETVDSGYASDSFLDLPSDDGASVTAAMDESLDHTKEIKPLRSETMHFDNKHLPLDSVFCTQKGNQHRIESDILLALSLGQPSDAVAFYKRSVSASGLPLSSISLETAITASLRARQGDPAEAEELLHSAEDAGLNVSTSLMPLIIERIQRPKSNGDRLDPDDMTKKVVEFYQSMHQNGVPVRHHVATTAARALLKAGQSQQAVSLLRGVYDSEWNKYSGKPLDIAAMTVLLQSYIKMDQKSGIDWTVSTVLGQEMRIDTAFLKVLRNGERHARSASSSAGAETANVHLQQLHATFEHWQRVCEEREAEQHKEATRSGNELVRSILKCIHKEPAVDISEREELETKLFGEKWDAKFRSTQPMAFRPKYLHGSRSLDLDTTQGTVKKRSNSLRKHEQATGYRAFLRRGLQVDGKRAKFRYVDSRFDVKNPA